MAQKDLFVSAAFQCWLVCFYEPCVYMLAGSINLMEVMAKNKSLTHRKKNEATVKLCSSDP